MTVRALLAELERRGIRLWAEGGRLRYDAPAGALDDALRAELKACRAALLERLAGEGVVDGDGDGPSGGDDDGNSDGSGGDGSGSGGGSGSGAARPLSFGQQRLWFLNQLTPDDRAYNVPATVRLEGALDERALARAIDEVVRRHETLRSRFPSEDGRATLVVEPFCSRLLPVESLEGTPAEERLAEVTRRAREDARRAFDLGAGPLFRVRLFRLGPQDHVLHVVMHHIVSDGWSMGVFFKELAALYGAFLRGEPSPLPDLPLQYSDHARWQQRQFERRGPGGDLDWWVERLGEDLPTLELPTDRPRRPGTARRGAHQWFPLDAELHAGVGRLAQREGATRFHMLLSAFLVLLSRHSGQQDVVIGTPTAGRGRREIEGLIGFFVNNLVLRGDLSGDPSFRELLGRVRSMVVDAFAHQDTPFERIVEALAPERVLGRNPLFQVLFNHFAIDEHYFDLPPFELSTIDMTLDVSKFDLTLHCFEADGRLVAKFEYDSDLFDAGTVREMGERFVTLLRGIVADPACRISRLPLLPADERRRLLVDWNRSEGDPPAALSVHGMFEAQAALDPDAPALVVEEQRLTRGELDRRASALARRLVARGVGPETRVALFLDRSVELIVALLGVLKAGGAFVPVDPSVPPERLAYMLDDARCRLLLTRAALSAQVPAHGLETLLVDGPDAAGDGAADGAADGTADGAGGDAASGALPAARPGQLAYVIYTSGSTGRPKGVEVEHAQLLHYLAGIVPRLDVPPGSSYASVSTLAADLGHTALFPALCGGGCLHLLTEERIGDGDAFAAYMAHHAVDVLKIVPSHLEALLAAAARPAGVLPRRLLVLGGEACTWELVERCRALAPDCAVMNHYGPAEATVGALTHRIAPGDRGRFPVRPPVGRPLANTRVYLVDAHLQPVPRGAAGELLIGGGGVARGYCGQPTLGAERFVPDPFGRGAEGRVYRTGDLARYTPDGELVFVGRNDEQVKLRGYRVELGEVRTALESHPAVATCAVLVRKDPLGVPRLVAWVVPRPASATDPAAGPESGPGSGPPPEPAALRAFLQSRLPDYMLPACFVLLDELPLTPNGKLDRRALPPADFDREALREGYVAPRTPAEETLARIWSEVLRLERVGVHDNFFELGGESILSIQIVSRANQAGLGLKPRDVFERPTIAELASAAAAPVAKLAEQEPLTGEVPLTPIQHRFLAQDLAEPCHYNHALLLAARRPLEPDPLGRALAALERHHDALRLRFARRPTGWVQTVAAPEERDPLERHDLSSMATDAWRERLEALARAAHAALDLENGPLWRALHVRLPQGEGERLLLVVHHLAVDGVSWRLLLEDLARAYGQLEAGEAVALPPKTSSWRRWAERLVERAKAPDTLRAAAFWLDASRRHAPALPRDRPAAADANLAADAQTLEVVLDEEQTTRLLREVPRAYRTQINDALLTALVAACAPWTGAHRLRVDLEGHGREDVFDDVDSSRTVGWFTSVGPVVLDTQGAADPGAALCLVKEQLRALPGRGMDWGLLRWLAPPGGAVDALRALPPAEIGFNYMGRFDQSVEDSGLFARAPESPGPGTSPRNRRHYLLDVGGAVTGGRLSVSFTWCAAVHERATVAALAERFLEALRALIDHCTAPGAGRRTPSDVPLARLDARELAALEARYGADAIEDVYVLSPLQRGMLFHSLAEPDSPAYVTQLALTLRGELDGPAFRRAWQAALDAHPALRTAFVVQGLRELHQVVCRAPALRWETEDWSALPAEEQRERLEACARAERERGFDLGDAPLMRFVLIRLGERRHRFLWTHHHVLLDGWSLPLLVHDVFDAYRRGAPPAVVRRPYADYIRWLGRQDDERARAHWRALLAGWSEPTPLPHGGDPPGGRGAGDGSSGVRGTSLERDATDALLALARRRHLTLNTLVQAAWALLLARHAGREEVLFGVTVSGRPPQLPGVESMLGLFINTLPLRVDVRDGPLLPWLARLQAQLVELQQLQASPLYEVQQLAGGRGAGPLFESLVVFENYPVAVAEPLQDAGLVLEDAADVSHATYPLALVAQPREGLHLELRYDTRRFGTAAVDRLLAHLCTLLRSIAARPEADLSQLDMLTEAERDRQLVAWNATDAPYPRDATVPELFARQARAASDAPALAFGEQELDYAALDRRSDALAACLQRRGVGPGDVVAIRVERGVAMIVGLLAILKAGAAYLPLDAEDPVRRAAFMLEDSGAKLLIVPAGPGAAQGPIPDADAAPPGLPTPPGGVLRIDRDGRAPDEAAAPLLRPVARAATDAAYLIYTSGSTGRPKGTVIAHRGITRLVKGADYVQLVPGDRVAQASNASFDAATFEIWGALLNGACLVGVSRDVALSPRDLKAMLRAERISVLFVTTALFNQLVRHEPEIFATLRCLLFGGEAVSPRWVRTVLERGRPQRLLHVYGPTECTTYSTWHEVERVPDDAVTVPIGQPIAHSTAYVLDRDRRPVPVGAPGELYLGGDGLALGYHARPELTAERFVPHPFREEPGARLYRTGDLVRRRDDGAIEFLGRIDGQVKLRGFRIEPGEIEQALVRQPAVREAVVLCREDEPGDKRLVAYVVAADGEGPDADALRGALHAALAEDLPDFMLPAAIVPLAALPLTPNGKVDRRALPAPEGRPSAQAPVEPRSVIERRVAAIWRDVLGLESVGLRDNFFDLGGHSLKLLSVHARLAEELGSRLSITDLFQHTTVEAQARALGGGDTGVEPDARAARDAGERDGAVAVVAMAGRFPGARDVEAFWSNLCEGVESVRVFTDEELRAAGVPEEQLSDPRYVRARAVLDEPDRFDARFFGYSPREAELMDPQHRLFLECAADVLERACIDPERSTARIGVFAGASMNSYLENLRSRPEVLARAGGMGALIASVADFLATRVSYQFDLHGPSMNVQTACSTSLVAIHEACRSLIERRSDVALAGGVSVTVPWTAGYLHEEGGVRSPDGHCRAFDARAEGMVSGNGLAIVALKRLHDALADGDEIQAVILGSATNNDGSRKVGFTAPSIEGQAEVIAAAQSAAGIDARSIGYVECHGTGTRLGDPIEVAALTRVFRERTSDRGFCALASLKSNMGHLDAAAGAAGLIKAALAVRHGRIPPSLHFERPNPEIDFASSPFHVAARCLDWRPADGAPRRAAVSAFGIGGTNAHAILEQPPERAPSGPSRPWQLLQLSARTAGALERRTADLAAHLRAHPEAVLADVAHSLRVGRREFEHRRAVLCRDASEALEALEGRAPERRWTGRARAAGRPVLFLFPGQGAQYPDMARDLMRDEPSFRAAVDECFALLPSEDGVELRAALFPADATGEGAQARLARTRLAQPALFIIEYALARLWMSWGLAPAATLGHSVGEYVSACLAGVLALPDALRLVALRGRLMDAMPPGVLLAVPLSEEQLATRLAGCADLWLTGVNGLETCLVGGTEAAVAAFEAGLLADGVAGRRLHTSHAFHSGLMEGAVAPFVEEARRVRLRAPDGVPYVSSLTGERARAEEVTDPVFWGRQIREPVRYSPGIARLLEDPDAVLLEVGPGNALGALARGQPSCGKGRIVLSSLRHPQVEQDDQAFLLGTLARLWIAGVAFDAAAFAGEERRHRLTLPTYPFERERYWIERRATPAAATARRPIDDWFHVPVWRPARALAPAVAMATDATADGSAPDGAMGCAPDGAMGCAPSGAMGCAPDGAMGSAPDGAMGCAPDGAMGCAPDGAMGCALVFEPASGTAAALAQGLVRGGRRCVVVRPGTGFSGGGDAYVVAPGSEDDHARLLAALRAEGASPDTIVHAWSAGPADDPARELDLGFHSVRHLVRALGDAGSAVPVRLTVVTSGVCSVTGREPIRPERATLSGMLRVVPLEQPELSCRLVDIDAGDADDALAGAPAGVAGRQARLDALLAELRAADTAPVVALRDGRRWVESFAPVPLGALAEGEPTGLHAGGVYLITGGLGGMGLALARALHGACGARLVLLGRSELPGREPWQAQLTSLPADDPRASQLRALIALEAQGAELLVLAADVGDARAVGAAVAAARQRFGRIHGVVHAAGVPPAGLVLTQDAERARAVLAPKLAGTRALLAALADDPPDVVVLCSSLNAVKGFPGAADYAAANAFLDAFARGAASGSRPEIVSIAWSRWRESGMAVRAAGGPLPVSQGLSDAEGGEVLRRVLAHRPGASVLVSEYELRDVLRETGLPGSGAATAAAADGDEGTHREDGAGGAGGHARPELASEFVAPRTATEGVLAAMWSELFGIDSVGVDDSFFELGGHSLLATQLINRIARRWPGAGLTLRAVFDSPTIAGLAARLGAGDGAADGPAVPAAAGEGERTTGTLRARDADALSEQDVADLSDEEVAELLKRLSAEDRERR